MLYNWVLFHWTIGCISKLVNAMPCWFHPYSRWICGSWKAFCFSMGYISQQQTSCLTIMLYAFCLVLLCFPYFECLFVDVLTCQPPGPGSIIKHLEHSTLLMWHAARCVVTRQAAHQRSFGDGTAHRGNRQEQRMGEFVDWSRPWNTAMRKVATRSLRFTCQKK